MLRRLLAVIVLFSWTVIPGVLHADGTEAFGFTQAYRHPDRPSEPGLFLAQAGSAGPREKEDPMQTIRGIGRFVPGDPRLRVAQLLLDVKNGKTGEYFYRELGKIGKNDPGVNMALVNSVKTAIGEIGGDALLEQFLGRRFEGRQGTPVETLILSYRRDLTKKAILEVIRDPKIRSLAAKTRSRVFLAFVGKWATQSPMDFTFSGDIDFSFVGGNAELILAMRDLFDAIIVRETDGLTMKQLDSFATAHGFATSDVYVGEAGRKYGDDEIVKGKVSRIDFEQGGFVLDAAEGAEAILQSILEEAILEAGKRGGLLDKSVDIFLEKLDARANVMTEPMISLEMIRHLEHDIILHGESFPALDTIVKGCKYLYRSNLYFKTHMGVDPANRPLADFATRITQMAKTASPGDMAECVARYFQEVGMIYSPAEVDYVPGRDGKPKAVLKSNREKAQAFLQTCMKSMWSNVERGLRVHLEDLKRRRADFEEKVRSNRVDEQTLKDMETFRKRLSQLLKGIKTELEEFDRAQIELPAEVKGLCQEVVRISEDIGKITGMRRLTLEEEKQLELVKKLLDGEAAHSKAMALSTMLDLANRFIQRTNARIDWIDDTIMGPLRGDPSFEDFIREIHERNMLLADLSAIEDPAVKARLAEFQGTLTNRFRKKTYDLEVSLNTLIYKNAIARGVKKINVTMNEFIQSTQSGRAAMSGLTAFNLAQEISAYTQAYARDGLSGFAAEIIRRRVPFGSAAENIYQGNLLLAGWDTLTTIFPPVALPYAAYGVVSYATMATVSYAWSSDLELLIDGLYASASWDEVTAGGKPRFRLAAVTYKDRKYDRESLEKGQTFLLHPEVDTVLWANLAQGDPFLSIYEEMQKHPAAGDRVRDAFVRKYEERWLAMKKAFVKSTIENLEKRKNAEEATATGKIAKVYDSLMRIAGNLAIRDQVLAAMEGEWGSSTLQALWVWLKNANRSLWDQPLAEKEATRAAAIVMDYHETYRAVLAARTAVEEAVAQVFEKDKLGAPPTEQHRQRILTGPAFLTGRAGEDREAVKAWSALPAALDAAVERELLAIKAESAGNAALDSPFDRETHGKVFFEDFWIRALQQMKVPVLSVGSVKTLMNERIAARNRLVKNYRDRYALERGTVTVVVRQQHGTKRTDLPVTHARVTLKAGKAAETALENRGNGQYTMSGFQPGSYVLTVKAEGFAAAADGKTDAFSRTVKIPSPKESGKALDPILVYLIVKDRGKQPLDVAVVPATAVIKESGEGSTVTLTPVVVPKKDSGKLSYQWVAGDSILKSGKDAGVDEIGPITFSGRGQSGKDVKITLAVFDEKNRQGVGQSIVKVVPVGLGVRLKPHRPVIHKNESEIIEVEEPRAADGSLRYNWTIGGDGVRVDKDWSAAYTINGPEYAGKTLSVTVTVTDRFGSTGRAFTRLSVKDEDAPDRIPVAISPESATIAEDGEIELTVTAKPFPDSGRLSFNGVAMPPGTAGYRFRYIGKDTTYAPPVTSSVTVTVADEKGRTGEAVARIHVTKKGDDAPQDPGTQAQTKYRWLRESVAYLEALKEYDRKSYSAFEKSVTSSIVREFVAQAPPRNEKDFKLPDGPDKALCGETFGDIRDRLTRFEAECWSALNAGCKPVGTREVTRTVDGRPMQILEAVTSCEAPCGKAQSCSNVLKTYTGQLGYANSLQDYVNGKQLSCLGEAAAAHGRHQRELDAKIKNLPESLPYKRYQEYAGLSDWKGYLAAVDKVKQEFGLPDPIPSPIVLPWSYSSPCGGKGGAPEQPRELKVTLTADRKKIRAGELSNVTASVTGGKPDYRFAWTGNHAGSGSRVTFTSRNPGKQTLSVEVVDAAGARGQASIELEVEALKVAIRGLKDRVIYGTTAQLSAQFEAPPDDKAAPPPADSVWKAPNEEEAQKVWNDTFSRLAKACERFLNKRTWTEFFREDNRAQWMKYSECEDDAREQATRAKNCSLWPDSQGCKDYKPPVTEKPKAPTGYRVVWLSEPAITFDPSTSDGETTVLFDRMPPGGKIRIWAQLQKESGGGVYSTVGEAPQVETTVVPPGFKWTFVPEKGKGNVGREVRVSITTVPEGIKPELLSYEWSLPESSNRMEYEKNASVIGFVPKDPKPVLLLVAPKVPYHREPIGGGLKEEYQAGSYTVTVTGPVAKGPKPQLWQEGKGLVEVDRAIAVFQQVTLRAEVSPKPEKETRWKWDVTPPGCTVSNDISQEITVSCSETGSYTAKVTARDPDGIELGSGTGSISVTISQTTLNESAKKAKEAQDKAKSAEEAKKKLAGAKDKARKGDYDGAIRDAEEAAKLDPANREAAATAQKLRQEKETIHRQIDKAKKLMDENKFADAQKELIVASNLNGTYPPVQQANQELGTRWNKYNAEVRDKVYEVRSANERKDFGKALEIAAAWRASTKLDAYADRELKQQEDWARQWKAQKDRQIGILKAAGEKVRAYDYAGALKLYDEGFANGQNLYSGTEPEYKEAVDLRSQAFTKNKRLNEIVPYIRRAAEDPAPMPVDVLQGNLKAADEAIALQPTNEQLKKYKAAIEARLARTAADNQRIAQGRKYLDAARAAENSFLSQDASVRADSGRWGESVELSMQEHLTRAIENYRASLAYIPDANVEKRIKELQATLEGRRKFLENVRLSKKLLADADVLAREARAEQNFDASQQKFVKAIELYQQSLNLYRPSNAETIAKIIHNLDIESKTRAFRKYRADGTALEPQRPVEALAALEKAATFRTYAIHEGEWIEFGGQLQNLRSRVQTAKSLRARGESEQQQGRIAQAVASYEASLKLVPDEALAAHVQRLKTQLAKGDEKKQSADRLWQEGTALFNQGQPSAALAKFKESVGLWPDATRQKYVADLEARRAKAAALREEGARLQNQNRIPQAVAKYRESLTHWPDPGLTAHIAALEKSSAGGRPPTVATGPVVSSGGGSAASPPAVSSGYYHVDLTPYGGKKGTPRKVKGIEVDDGSWVRLKATHEKRLRLDIPLPERVAASAVAVVSNLDNAHNVPDKMTTTVLTVHTTSGDRTFEIKAGVHSSEWNRGETGGATHAWPKETNIGGPRWMAVFSLPAGSVVTGLRFDHRDTDKKYYHGDAAPGFCLRGVTLVGSPVGSSAAGAAETAASLWAGAWKSDPGPDGEVVSFNLSQSGSRLTGTFRADVPYTSSTGARQKESFRGTLEGTVSGSRVTGSFRASNDTKPSGYFEFTMAASGNVFAAVVRAEDGTDTYTVRRSGSAASSGTSVSAGQTASGTVTAEITNRSRDYAHVFTNGETFGPANRLAPGEKRRVAVAMKPDGSVTFKAGRDGQVMATKTWRGVPGDASRVPVVVFDDTNPYDRLTVTTGLR